jgi:transcription-repair coupling factor (superfamily II helicase)
MTGQELLEELQGDRCQLELLAALTRGNTDVSIARVSGSYWAALVAGAHIATSRSMLVVARDKTQADEIADDLNVLLPGGRTALLTGESAKDAAILAGLASSSISGIVTTPAILLRPLPRPVDVRQEMFSVSVGDVDGLPAFLARATTAGFERKDFVEAAGDFAVRGGIVDIFPFIGDNPVRLEFSGDTLESLREFDPLSQRSIRQLSSAAIVPDVMRARDG